MCAWYAVAKIEYNVPCVAVIYGPSVVVVGQTYPKLARWWWYIASSASFFFPPVPGGRYRSRPMESVEETDARLIRHVPEDMLRHMISYLTIGEKRVLRCVHRRFCDLISVYDLFEHYVQDEFYHLCMYEPRLLSEYPTDIGTHYEERAQELWADIRRHGLEGLARDARFMIAGGFVLYHMCHGNQNQKEWADGDIDVFYRCADTKAEPSQLLDALSSGISNMEAYDLQEGANGPMLLRHQDAHRLSLRDIQIIPIADPMDRREWEMPPLHASCVKRVTSVQKMSPLLNRLLCFGFDINICQWGVHHGHIWTTSAALLGIHRRTSSIIEHVDGTVALRTRSEMCIQKYERRGFREEKIPSTKTLHMKMHAPYGTRDYEQSIWTMVKIRHVLEKRKRQAREPSSQAHKKACQHDE